VAARNTYTLAQAAQLLGMPEQQVLGFIESKHLLASFNQGLMGYMIRHDELIDFMKSRKMFAQMQKIMTSRVLLCDRDQQVQFLLRTELERGGKVVVKIATSGKEVEMAIHDHLPDVIVMHLAATQRATDNLAGLLRRARESRPIRLILYHNEPDVVIEGREDIKRIREHLKVDALVSIAGGTRKLLAAIEETLGIRRETKVTGVTAYRPSQTQGPMPARPPGTPPPPANTPPPNLLPTQPDPHGSTAIRKKVDTQATRRKTRPLPPIPPPP